MAYIGNNLINKNNNMEYNIKYKHKFTFTHSECRHDIERRPKFVY